MHRHTVISADMNISYHFLFISKHSEHRSDLIFHYKVIQFLSATHSDVFAHSELENLVKFPCIENAFSLY